MHVIHIVYQSTNGVDKTRTILARSKSVADCIEHGSDPSGGERRQLFSERILKVRRKERIIGRLTLGIRPIVRLESVSLDYVKLRLCEIVNICDLF